MNRLKNISQMRKHLSKYLRIGSQKVLAMMFLVYITIEPVLAGPGGHIAEAAFETFWGRVVLGILTVIFLPWILYVYTYEYLATRRARKDLRYMATLDSRFEWLKIKERATDCFYRVHNSWSDEQMSQTAGWMTSWYWLNQQFVFLNRWKREGLINICNVKKITKIKPLFFVHRNDEAEHEGSIVVVVIEAKMQDYLQDRETKKIVEGSKKYKEVERLWSFTLDDGAWKVSNIEESGVSLEYAKLVNEIPEIETTLAHYKYN
jgi:hypothetical protein